MSRTLPARALVLAALLGLALSACAFVDESVVLKPTSQLAASDIGKGQRLGLKVIDERTTTTIGYRGPARSAQIRSAQDVRQLIQESIAQGLRAQGFDPVMESEAEPALLTIQIRELSYETTTGFFSGGIHTRAALKGIARRGQASHEELYRAEEEARVMVVPTEAFDAEQINLVLSRAIDKLLADQRLLQLLAN